MKKAKLILALLLIVILVVSLVACGEKVDNTTPTPDDNNGSDVGGGNGGDDPTPTPSIGDGYDITSIADALAICGELTSGAKTPDRYYLLGTITELSNAQYGSMTIQDETGSIYVYGTYDAEGNNRYSTLEEKPVEGDVVLLYGNLQNYNGTLEVYSGWIIAFQSSTGNGGNGGNDNPAINPGDTITIAQALALAASLGDGNVTTDRYYIRGTITNISKPEYGEMTIQDETGKMDVYGSYSADGQLRYSQMDSKPIVGDEVLFYATIKNFKGTGEINSGWIIEFTPQQFNPDNYDAMSIANARDAEKGALVKLTGVVACIAYANGKIPCGFILVDGTSSIYVFDRVAAADVAIGNTVTICGAKTWWVLETEQSNATKFGYKGCNQIEKVHLVANDGLVSNWDTSWVVDSTVKDVMDTPCSTDISTLVFKVNALVKKDQREGFVNYNFFDLDGTTYSYAYTQCNGSDFDWLDQFDGKICTVYLTALNAKSTSTGCNWRFLPVHVVDEGFQFNLDDAAAFAIKYYAVDQFDDLYAADPAKELITSLSSDLLEFEGVAISYSSSDTSVAYVDNGVLHTAGSGDVTITITATLAGHASASAEVSFSVMDLSSFDALTVAQAIACPVGEDANDTITVRGVVGPSLVNQPGGFYLIDETGVIAVKLNNATALNSLSIGDEIILTGQRDVWKQEGIYPGQTCITKAVVEVNLYGHNEYSTASFNRDLTIDELFVLAKDVSNDHSTEVYVLTVTITKYTAQYSSGYNVMCTDGTNYLALYCSGAGQYAWLDQFVDQEVVIEIALCNWNAKNPYKACILAVYLPDGTKVVNSLNFG